MKNYQYMNLEQKIIKIRKKIPALTKKFYSEEVNYDFSKLDDIYELMTPALNKYNVNFDIIGEKPTQYNAEGKQVYLTVDKDGYWKYEADLELCWVNADRPEERRTVTIHAIGTHEIPDKAKGVAWTYALKVYFRNKFSIPQDSESEDPDMRGRELPDIEQPKAEEKSERSGSSVNRKASESQVKTGQGQKKNSRKEASVQDSPGAKEPKPDGGKKSEAVFEKPEVSFHEKKEKSETGIKEQETKVLESQEKTSAAKTCESKEKTGAAGEKVFEKETATKTVEETGAVSGKQQADGFETLAEEDEVPFDEFDEDSFMAALKEDSEKEEEQDNSAYEKARNHKCNFGIFQNKTLGEILDSGPKGKEGLKWIAKSYKGSDKELKEAANLLLEYQSMGSGAKAA